MFIGSEKADHAIDKGTKYGRIRNGEKSKKMTESNKDNCIKNQLTEPKKCKKIRLKKGNMTLLLCIHSKN